MDLSGSPRARGTRGTSPELGGLANPGQAAHPPAFNLRFALKVSSPLVLMRTNSFQRFYFFCTRDVAHQVEEPDYVRHRCFIWRKHFTGWWLHWVHNLLLGAHSAPKTLSLWHFVCGKLQPSSLYGSTSKNTVSPSLYGLTSLAQFA